MRVIRIGEVNMSLIDETWAKENEDKHIFPEISDEADSYYKKRNSETTYMMEYFFKTVAELEKALVEYSGVSSDGQILKMLAIEICENRYVTGQEKCVKKEPGKVLEEDTQGTELPEFVYIF